MSVASVVSIGLVALPLPVLIGIKHPISLCITAFALFEAWKINRAPVWTITGPHAIATPQATGPAKEAAGTDAAAAPVVDG